ncbi:MAG: TetR/AcrR family transcriptional regulator [Clostridia bacterium]|nr:TetR/AcrR family transcriptional regulator [Clostridia bacterium]
MNKSNSKYFNTARLMDQALLLLLEKKDLEFITVKEICEKAGVNRSTFYLHYENITDLFNETIEMLNDEFKNSFSLKDVKAIIEEGNPKDLVFINREFLLPYLEYVKKNKKILKIVHEKASLFKNDAVYKKMSEEIFYPILSNFNIKKEERPYKLEFFTRGTIGIVNKWLELDCVTSIDEIINLIIDCVGFKN